MLTVVPASHIRNSSSYMKHIESNYSWFMLNRSIKGLLSNISKVIGVLKRQVMQTFYRLPVHKWLKQWRRLKCHYFQYPTANQVLHPLYERVLGFSAIVNHCSAFSAILQLPWVPKIRMSFLWILKRKLNMADTDEHWREIRCL